MSRSVTGKTKAKFEKMVGDELNKFDILTTMNDEERNMILKKIKNQEIEFYQVPDEVISFRYKKILHSLTDGKIPFD